MSIFLHWSQVAAKMGRTSKWLKSFLGSSKKEKSRDDEEKNGLNQPSAHDEHLAIVSVNPPTKEKRRWSFRRSVNRDTNSLDQSMNASSAVNTTSASARSFGDSEDQQKKHAIAVAAATAAAADAAIAAAQAAAAVIRLTTTTRQPTAAEERAATKIQAAFRSYLARKALRALRGLVKLQALVRGHLVRRQATATLRCMHALVTVQARARAQRLQMFDEAQPTMQRSSTHRRSAYENKFRQSTDMDRMTDENVKIVEMDMGESRGVKSKINYISPQEEQYRRYLPPLPKLDHIQSPAPSSVLTDASPRACSGHFEEFSFATTAKSSPQYFSDFSRPYLTRGSFGASQIEYAESISNDYLFPNYMANTESSKAKARSQSAPKQRPDSYDKTPTKKKGSADGRGVPRGVKMQRSSSHVGATCKGYHYTPSGSIKLDRSTVSLKDSECGSTCSVLTDVNYCRSLVAIEAYSHRL